MKLGGSEQLEQRLMTQSLNKWGLVAGDEKIGMIGFEYLGYFEVSYHCTVSDLCHDYVII